MRQLEVLKNGIYGLFKDFEIGSNKLYEALGSLKYSRIPKGETLFLKGDSDKRQAYLILNGKVAVCAGKKSGV
jgi:CRP-like cAMP-binding protein